MGKKKDARRAAKAAARERLSESPAAAKNIEEIMAEVAALKARTLALEDRLASRTNDVARA